ncbi:hypothetical protein LTR10_021534 [Elasticomyces elasticus]|uniref:Uncharacterized protein n=1 Tax=Exophiala sideris TaxID=1016849 RepID=A0ABR0J934_9EURO|nr:hypothetical protein LTR10_021534 [Elasticomyces elasticus]KAK5027990.1 hypothetical protein LTS07_006866 [Exophiala sideris]KAK5037419.1 hypothetical protein LTR13_004576 [Exophiala sideris]KAK5059081.1 hypothetical protein LTR69_006370 [Exophiala sideris]KAK5182914.1 hypothetical protein LTR44_004624 [Eurotiomycetes sp. CCFEE 6388]
MALRDIYQRFLDLPNPISLSQNASLHYITTLTSFSQSAQIIRHLETQNKNVVSTKSVKVISAVEGTNSLALEVETLLEFISGGGTYLPGLENFIVDKIATIPTTHFVHFDAERKISQIRISWDQASLLRQAEVIGSRGNQWPVCDGKDQIRLITFSSNAAPTIASEVPTSQRGRPEVQSFSSSRNVSPSKKHIKDPYASLDLFSRKATDENRSPVSANPVAPRASARPPPREMSELFAAGHEDHEPGSPKKVHVQPVIAPKGGGREKYAPSRLFSDESNEPAAVGYKSDPTKYNHFDLGEAMEDDPMQHRENASNTNAVPLRPKTTKGQSQWGFEDFSTPPKVPQKVRGQDVVHFSMGSNTHDFDTPQANKVAPKPRRDNESHFELQDDGTPVQRHVVPKARKDADTHFQFRDTATPAANRTSSRPTTSASDRSGLYANNVIEEGDDGKTQPLSTITNNTGRKNTFDSHWEMSDVGSTDEKLNNENGHVGENRKKAAEMMNANWDTYDHRPEQSKRTSVQQGQKKNMESHWRLGEDEQPPTRQNQNQSKPQKSFWDF